MRGIEADGEKLKLLRQSKGFTQEQLCGRADCDVTTLRKAEKSGRMDLGVLTRIADSLGVTIKEISSSSSTPREQQQRNIEVVDRWNDAFFSRDLELTLSFHHPDGFIELPSAEGTPHTGTLRGIAEITKHYEFCYDGYDDFQLHSKQIDACENLVFLRSEASFRIIANGKRFGSWYLNEFEMQDSLIFRRTVITDYGEFREALKDLD